MARSSGPSGHTPIDAYQHADKRVNNPTADAVAEWGGEEDLSLPPVPFTVRNPALDPQLVWRGKFDGESDDIQVDAPPIYIQEKIDPRVLIENLRKTAVEGEQEPELTLFDHFDGLDDPLAAVEYYQHEMGWSNRMILGDSLQVMGSLAEREQLRGKVQMIYLDPPYGIRFGSNWQVSARKRDVKDGKIEDAAREAEQIKAFRDTWQDGVNTYLSYLRDRLVLARELLTESGSVFVQIGDENVHLVRSLLDEVFGRENFVTMVTLSKTTSSTNPHLGGTADYILWFARAVDSLKYRTLWQTKAIGVAGSAAYGKVETGGERRPLTREERRDPSRLPRDARPYTTSDLTSQAMGREKGEGAASWFPIQLNGQEYLPSMQARWKTHEDGMRRLLFAERVEIAGRTPRYVRYIDDFPAYTYSEIWTDIGGAVDKSYVVQTAERVVERCMLMTTDPGDLVLDPTCGSGTTAYVAEQWGRRWITIDTSRVALALARQRLMGGKYPYYLLADSPEGWRKELEASGQVGFDTPAARATQPPGVGGDIRQGFVYERVQHITLKSIANNPDIHEGMRRDEIDAAIKRHADFELLYDKPYEDRKRVRVTGPFTVESLSPLRSLSFGDAAETAEDADNPDFTQTILDSLRASGIQNGRRDERLEFATLEPYAGTYVQAVGAAADPAGGIAIAIGPQYGTVSPAFVKAAAKEALDAEGVRSLYVLGFSFDPQATGVTEADGVTIDVTDGFESLDTSRRLGRLTVQFVRMNAELLMGDALRKTGAGNLFTVFGEPDIEIRQVADRLEVELLGVDVYDPTTGKVRSRQTDRIALWMIDTDYDDESFFVRHCYFTGGGDPMKKLERALKADIDPDAWAALYRTTSLPFEFPSTGRIAVKVINDYGDEVMKVFDLSASDAQR